MNNTTNVSQGNNCTFNVSQCNNCQLSHCYNYYTVYFAGADPGEGHRGQMTPPSEPCQGSQKMDVLV